MTQIKATFSPVLFELGFRIFFLSAGIFALISIALWGGIYFLDLNLITDQIPSSQWHAHEMIYGYAMAVVAGFLLTAAKNWTGIQTLRRKPLMLLFSLWLLPRLLFLSGTKTLELIAISDLLFSLGLVLAVTHPIVKTRQWKQLAIVFKLLTLALLNLAFYLGVVGIFQDGARWGIYGGLYLIIALVLTLGRRVLPFFIEKGIAGNVELKNARWLDLTSLFGMLAFLILELFVTLPMLSGAVALLLFVVNAIRLIGWYTPQIWQKSLLWSLYIAFWFICLGFGLFASHHFFETSFFLAIHAFAFGGIGLVTLAMMSRVSLGHSGRGIANPSTAITYAFVILVIGAIIRVLFPIAMSQYYTLWIALSLLLWIAAFVIFVLVYLPILSRPRVDGRPG